MKNNDFKYERLTGRLHIQMFKNTIKFWVYISMTGIIMHLAIQIYRIRQLESTLIKNEYPYTMLMFLLIAAAVTTCGIGYYNLYNKLDDYEKEFVNNEKID